MNWNMVRKFYEPDGNQGGDASGTGASGSNAQTTGGDANGANGTGTEGTGTAGTGTNGSQQQAGATGKTFTQEEMSAVAATEKQQGKSSVYKMFGVKDDKEAKAQAEAFKKWQDEQKTADQKKLDAEKAATDAEQRALAAENKLTCITAGVNKDSLDDALAIAILKVTEAKDLTAVLTEMKAQPKYKGFFEESTGSKGTGNPANHPGSGVGGNDNIGKRLAEKAVGSQPKKSSYFE